MPTALQILGRWIFWNWICVFYLVFMEWKWRNMGWAEKNVLRWPHLINIHVRSKLIAEWVAVLNLLKLSVVIWNANIMCILAKKSVEAPPSCINLNKNLRMDWNKNQNNFSLFTSCCSLIILVDQCRFLCTNWT